MTPRSEWARRIALAVAALFVVSCAGTMRECSSCTAGEFGADWIVVQLRMDGTPFRCWELHDVSVANEPSSDGIYWQSADGHLVHISNFYNRVQVEGGDFASAYEELGITRAECSAASQGDG